MKVILQKDVKEVGKVGDLVAVAAGFARNFLFPRKLAVEATEKRVKEYEHLNRVAEAKRKKAVAERQELLNKMGGVSVKFKLSAGDSDKLFGSVTTADISKELEKAGFSVDRRDIHLDEQIKVLGTHKATVKFGEGQTATVQVVVERAQ
jgi:large subunit ribosomal protein L9